MRGLARRDPRSRSARRAGARAAVISRKTAARFQNRASAVVSAVLKKNFFLSNSVIDYKSFM